VDACALIGFGKRWLAACLNPFSSGSDGRGYRRHILAGCGLGASDRSQLLIDAGAEVEGADERLNEAKDLGESTGGGWNSRLWESLSTTGTSDVCSSA